MKPNKPIHVLQRQSGEVTCEAEGPSVSTLKWEKQQDDKSYAAVPKSQVYIIKDTKYVRATLKITNAQLADTGTYKCTVSVPPNKSDYKVTAIKVKGRFVCFCHFVYTLVGVYCPVRKNCSIFIYPCITDITSIMIKNPGVEFLVADPGSQRDGKTKNLLGTVFGRFDRSKTVCRSSLCSDGSKY